MSKKGVDYLEKGRSRSFVIKVGVPRLMCGKISKNNYIFSDFLFDKFVLKSRGQPFF